MPARPTNGADIDARRMKVFELFRVGFTQNDIAAKLGIAQSTVSADLRHVRKEFHRKYAVNFDPLAVVHEELEHLEWTKQRALREYQRMLPVTGQSGKVEDPRDTPSEVRARLKALDTAKQASIDRITLLQDLGLVDRHLGDIGITGEDLAKALREVEQAEDRIPDNISEGERAWLHPTSSSVQ